MSTLHEPPTITMPAAPGTPPPGKPRKKWHQRWLVRIPAVATVGLVAIIVATSGSHSAAAPAANSVPASPSTSAPAAPATHTPATQAPARQQPAAPAGPTVSQQQALTAAQGYLSDGQGFSRAGLIDQLTSQYGNGFSVADATWAADHSGADWNAQAVIAAKGYMSDGQGFSRASLIDQLTSQYGSQFTLDQATYAANQVGL